MLMRKGYYQSQTDKDLTSVCLKELTLFVVMPVTVGLEWV